MANTFAAGAVAGLIGGVAGAFLFSRFDHAWPRATPAYVPMSRRAEIVSANRIQLVDPGGKVRAEFAMTPDNGPALFFYDSAGRNRLVLGLYSSAEGEAPSVVLSDASSQAAGIFRLFGPHDTPVVVLKSGGRDRSVFGLNPNSTDPFLANYAADGKKSDVFGDY
jgi:hypothetical protein